MALRSLRVKNATILGIPDDSGVTKKSLFREVFVQNLLHFLSIKLTYGKTKANADKQPNANEQYE